MTQILWHDTVTHGPADYDFWYSLTGPEGPWIEIVSDVPRSGSYDWVVPDTPSDQVRLRVRQDNAEADYMDISDSDLAIVGSSTALSIELEPEKDATIYEEGNGSVANGSGAYLFTGRSETQNGSSERRALLAFSIADSVPEGSTITSASLELTVSRTISGAQTVNLHRVIEDWSEGPSDPSGQEGGGTSAVAGDVTWIHREYSGTPWSSSGASFEQSASAAAQVSDEGSYTFTSTSQLVADIQGWLDDPSSNFGWILVIDSPPSGSAKRFNSRENSSAGTRPTLTVEYQTDLEKPTAAFRVDPVHPDLGELVSFSDESTGGPTSWQWDFGDGQTSQEQNPTHTYTTPGGKTVTLVVTNASGPSSTSLDVRVGPRMRRPSSRLSPTN